MGLVELINKVLEERNKIKFKEFLQYLKENPRKSRRRYGFIQMRKRASVGSPNVEENHSTKDVLKDITSMKRGSVTFMKKGKSKGAPKTSRCVSILF